MFTWGPCTYDVHVDGFRMVIEVRSTFAERVLGPLAEAAEQLRAASAKQDFGLCYP